MKSEESKSGSNDKSAAQHSETSGSKPKARQEEELPSIQERMEDIQDRFTDEDGEITITAEGVQESIKDVRDVAKNLKQHTKQVKSSLTSYLRTSLSEFLDTFFGDFQLFKSIFNTIWVWVRKPFSIDVTQLPAKDAKAKLLGDFKLVKSLITLSFLFLVIEAGSELSDLGEEGFSEEESDQMADQIFFVLSFVMMLFVWIAMLFGWKKLCGIKNVDGRQFIGFLVYQHCTNYLLSFTAVAILGITTESWTGLVLIWLVPWAHSVYFLFSGTSYFKVQGLKTNVVNGLFAIMLFVYLSFPAIMAEVLFHDGKAFEEEAVEEMYNGENDQSEEYSTFEDEEEVE